MEKKLTTGSVWKNIAAFSLPYLLSYFLLTLYGMADLFIIGQYEGVAGTTAVSIGSQVMHMLTVMIVGLAMGTTVSVGHKTKFKIYFPPLRAHLQSRNHRLFLQTQPNFVFAEGSPFV